MKRFIALFKVFLNNNFNISVFKHKVLKQRKDLWRFVIFALAFLGFYPMGKLYIGYLNALYEAGKILGQKEVVLVFGILTSQFIVFFFGLIWVLSHFYYSEDILKVIPMPFRPYEVITAKLGVIMLNEYITLLFLLLPAFLIYGIKSGTTILYYIYAFLVYLLVPVVPITISAVITILLMRFITARRNKDLITIIAFVISFLFFFMVQLFMQNVPPDAAQQDIQRLAMSKVNSINEIAGRVPLVLVAGRALANWQLFAGFLNLLLFIGVSAVFLFFLFVISERYFYRGLLKDTEFQRRGRTLDSKSLERRLERARNPLLALLYKEWMVFIRTPIFVLNSIPVGIIVPIAFLAPILASKKLPEVTSAVSALSSPIIVLIGMEILTFIGGMLGIASSCFSREGKSFWILKMIPVDIRYQLLAKYLHTMAITYITLLPVIVIGIVLFKISGTVIFGLLILSLLSISGSALIQMMLDSLNPSLEWTNPAQPVKSNINVLLGIIINMFYVGLTSSFILLLIYLKLPKLIIIGLIAVLFLILDVILFVFLYLIADARYRKIENG